MVEMARLVPDAVTRVEALLPQGFPGPVWEAITGRLQPQAAKFLRGADRT
jgi:hypothetical protein